jgi:hypothetical protein
VPGGGSAYLIALETVLDECREMEEEISIFLPGLLRVLSALLAKKFAN